MPLLARVLNTSCCVWLIACVCCVTSVYCHLSIYDRRVSINQGYNWRMFKVLPYSARASPGNIVYVVYMCMHACTCMCVYVCLVWFHYMVYSVLQTSSYSTLLPVSDYEWLKLHITDGQNHTVLYYCMIPYISDTFRPIRCFNFFSKLHMIWRIFLTYFNTHP